MQKPSFFAYVFVLSGFAAAAVAAFGGLLPPELAKIAMYVFFGLVALHALEASLAFYLASKLKLNAPFWALQTFLVGFFALRLLLNRAKPE